MLRHIFKRATHVFALKLCVLTVSIAFHFTVAKMLGAAQFGLFTLAMTILVFSSTLAKLGLEQAIIKIFPNIETKHLNKIFTFVICYSGVSSFAVASLLWFLGDILSYEVYQKPILVELLPLVCLLTIFQTWLAVGSSILKSKDRPVVSILFTGGLTFALALPAVVVIVPNSALSVLTVFSICALISCFLNFLILLTKVGLKFSAPIYSKASIEIVNVSCVMVWVSLAALVTQQSSVLVLAKYTTFEEIGLYSIALKLALLFSYPLIAINSITAPQFSKLNRAGDISQLKKIALGTTKVLFFVATIAYFFLYFGAETLLGMIDKQYIAAAIIIKILGVGQWFNLASGPVVSILVMTGHEKLHRRNTLIIVSINIAALFIIIPKYGVIGAACTTAFFMALKNVVALFYVNKLVYSRTSV